VARPGGHGSGGADNGSAGHGVVNEAPDLADRTVIDERSEIDVLSVRRTDPDCRHLFGKGGGELLGDPVLHEEAVGSDT
jgi:hypothetical protein